MTQSLVYRPSSIHRAPIFFPRPFPSLPFRSFLRSSMTLWSEGTRRKEKERKRDEKVTRRKLDRESSQGLQCSRHRRVPVAFRETFRYRSTGQTRGTARAYAFFRMGSSISDVSGFRIYLRKAARTNRKQKDGEGARERVGEGKKGRQRERCRKRNGRLCRDRKTVDRGE